MIEKVKVALRITSNSEKITSDITDLIAACKLDLSISGVKKIDEDDPLICQAIKLYCKANFFLENNESEKYQKSYDMLKQSLSLCGDYNVE